MEDKQKPIIAVTCNYDTNGEIGVVSHMGPKTQDWNFVAADYIRAIERAGGIPIILPQLIDKKILEVLLERIDGVLISGGHDVSPLEYGQRVKEYCGSLMPVRDKQDIFLTKVAINKKIPILGICRGIQIMNVAFGGTLYQDLKKERNSEEHFIQMLPRNAVAHEVSIVKDTLLYKIFEKDTISVNSFHHQGIESVAQNAIVSAVSDLSLIHI